MNCPLPSPTRRQVLVTATLTATVPLLSSAFGTPPAPAAPENSPPAGKDNWTATELKAADLKDNEFTAAGIDGVVISRKDKIIAALSTECTHKGCAVAAKAGAKTLSCPCHAAQFNLDGTVAKTPAQKPLPHYAIRVNDKGLIEVDKTQKVTSADKSASVALG